MKAIVSIINFRGNIQRQSEFQSAKEKDLLSGWLVGVYHLSVAKYNFPNKVVHECWLVVSLSLGQQQHGGRYYIFESSFLRSPWHNNNSIIFLNSRKQHENRKFILWQSRFFDIMRLTTLIELVKVKQQNPRHNYKNVTNCKS